MYFSENNKNVFSKIILETIFAQPDVVWKYSPRFLYVGKVKICSYWMAGNHFVLLLTKHLYYIIGVQTKLPTKKKSLETKRAIQDKTFHGSNVPKDKTFHGQNVLRK